SATATRSGDGVAVDISGKGFQPGLPVLVVVITRRGPAYYDRPHRFVETTDENGNLNVTEFVPYVPGATTLDILASDETRDATGKRIVSNTAAADIPSMPGPGR